jgi:putative Mn2+ efflux pump MntP
MSLIELILIAVGLSMDAFAVSICKGLALPKARLKDALVVGLYFGGFQALMPLIGYFVGVTFADIIETYDHWIAFALLAFIGGKMVKESREEICATESGAISPKKMFPLAVATSIDALAVGVSLAFLRVPIGSSVALIGATTLLISMLGVMVGKLVGAKFRSRAEMLGGVILILIGVKILLEHLGILVL